MALERLGRLGFCILVSSCEASHSVLLLVQVLRATQPDFHLCEERDADFNKELIRVRSFLSFTAQQIPTAIVLSACALKLKSCHDGLSFTDGEKQFG